MVLELILNEISYSPEQMILITSLFLISSFAAIAINKFANAFMTKKLSDPSVSINPFKRIGFADIISVIMLFILGFSWVKHPKIKSSDKKNALISLSGPVANIIAAFLGLIIYQILFIIAGNFYKIGQNSIWEVFLSLFMAFVSVNAALAIFNLIPVPPLDGGNFIAHLLPEDAREKFLSFGNHSLFILVFLVVFLPRSGISNILIDSLINGMEAIVLPIFALFG